MCAAFVIPRCPCLGFFQVTAVGVAVSLNQGLFFISGNFTHRQVHHTYFLLFSSASPHPFLQGTCCICRVVQLHARCSQGIYLSFERAMTTRKAWNSQERQILKLGKAATKGAPTKNLLDIQCCPEQ
jgi:hypothetical protein